MEDPGWGPAMRVAPKQLVTPWRAFDLINRSMPGDQLTRLRSTWLVLFAALFLFWIPLSLIGFEQSDRPGAFPYVVLGLALVETVLLMLRLRRPLRTDGAEQLHRSYLLEFLVGFARAEGPAVLAFFGVIITGRLWIYALGFAFAVPMMLLIAPTRWNLRFRQRQITESGSPLSLIEALDAPLPRLGWRKRGG